MCDERERLIDYLYDECDADERARVTSHLGGCETCRDEIAALRGVRTDLLAWDVPAHESVWKPFAPPRPVAWYRQVPVWALAAAASLMLAVGAIGGVVAHAYFGRTAPERVVVADRASVTPVPVAAARQADPTVAMIPASDLQKVEDRILAQSQQSSTATIRELRATVDALTAKQTLFLNVMMQMNNDIVQTKNDSAAGKREFNAQLTALSQKIDGLLQGAAGGVK